MADKKAVMAQVEMMSEKARDIASETLKDVRRLVGLPKRMMFSNVQSAKQCTNRIWSILKSS
ncbi:MAG: hypothetical protein R2880_18560 [Deinococcales bacterium]